MFATCWICPQMGNQDRQRSKKLLKRGQVSCSPLDLDFKLLTSKRGHYP
jgi:hypothetical protein